MCDPRANRGSQEAVVLILGKVRRVFPDRIGVGHPVELSLWAVLDRISLSSIPAANQLFQGSDPIDQYLPPNLCSPLQTLGGSS